MSVNYGTKRIVVGAHYGTRDWLAQRVTAFLMALFTLILLVIVLAGTLWVMHHMNTNMMPMTPHDARMVD